MKKILLVVFALLAVLTTVAQPDLKPPTQQYDQYWMVGVRYGFAQFHGDVCSTSFLGKLDKESKPSFAINLGRQIGPAFSIKGSFTASNFYSLGGLFWHDSTSRTSMAVTGKISEIGVYGTLNLNKLFSKDKDAGNNWNAYVSTGIGFASWNSVLHNLDDKSIIAQVKNSVSYDYSSNDSTKISTSSKLSIPLTFGANIQIVDGVWLSLEHSIHFVNSDRVDGYIGGGNDNYSTTTFGITCKLEKLATLNFKRNREKVPSSTTPGTTTAKPEKKTILRASDKSKPEIQEYTGYTALLPPPMPKVDTTHKVKTGVIKPGKDIWVDQVDSGQLQITGAGKVVNEAITGMDPQALAELKTGLVPIYRVQVQASKTYIKVEEVIQKLDLKEKVSVELRPDGWYRYYIGQFGTLSTARAKLAEIRGKGVKDAFIVSFKSNIRKVVK